MTYRQLLNLLENMPKEKMDKDACVYVPDVDETWSIVQLVKKDWSDMSESEKNASKVEGIDGVLDDNHPFLLANFESIE